MDHGFRIEFYSILKLHKNEDTAVKYALSGGSYFFIAAMLRPLNFNFFWYTLFQIKDIAYNEIK